MMDYLSRLASIDLSSEAGAEELLEQLKTWLLVANCEVEIDSNQKPGWIWVTPKGRRRLDQTDLKRIFILPLESLASVQPSLWDQADFNPFRLHSRGDRLFCAGINQGKAALAAQMSALVSVSESVHQGWALVYVKANLINFLASELKNVPSSTQVEIVAPTEMKLAQGSIGFARVSVSLPWTTAELARRLLTEGQEATTTQSRIFHADDHQTAVEKLIEYIRQLPDRISVITLEAGADFDHVAQDALLEFETVAADQEHVGRRLIEVETIFGGLGAGVSPGILETFGSPAVITNIRTWGEKVTLSVSIRCASANPPAGFEQSLRELIEHLSRRGYPARIESVIAPFFSNPSLPAQEATEFLGPTPAKLFSSQSGSVRICGPGKVPRWGFGPNECIEPSQLEMALAYYRLAFCGRSSQ